MPSQRESLTVVLDENKEPTGLSFDPKIMSFSLLKEMVTNKVRSAENTTIAMYYPGALVYVDPAKLHEINCLPQQEKRGNIRRITNNIANADNVLIYSEKRIGK